MTRKLLILFVTLTTVTAVSVLQAQDAECPKSQCKSGDCSFWTSKVSTTDSARKQCTQCESCPKASAAACPACSGNCGQAAVVNSTGTARSAATNQVQAQSCDKARCSASAVALPGSTSFIEEFSPEASRQRQELAAELTSYLTSANHDPAHIQQVLLIALNSTADTAHRHAMTMQPQDTLLATVSQHEYVNQPTVETPSQPPLPVINPVDQREMEFRKIKRDQESMQSVITMIQRDLQKIAQDLSQMHVDNRIHGVHADQQNQPKPFARSRDMQGYQQVRTVSNPYSSQPPRPVTSSAVSSLVQQRGELQRQVASLQQQLRMERMNQMVRHTNFQEPVRLQPQINSPVPLTPAVETPVTISYYVGDVMEPPFVGATLKLMKHIKANVAPESWTHSSMMQIAEPSISLEITQTRENHEKIGEVLTQIRTGTRSYMRDQVTKR